MNDDTYLTKAELTKLTGSPQKSLQIEWLTKERWAHSTSRTGHPQVLRAYHNERMSGKSPAKAINQPNYGVFSGRTPQTA